MSLKMTNGFLHRNDSITLEQIKNFIAIYELGSLSLAAKAAHKTQPAITQTITKLEEKLSTRLVNRERGKSVSFTEEGHRFYQQVTPIVSQLLTQIDEVENRNTISIGVCDDASMSAQLEIHSTITEKINSRVRLMCDFSHRIRAMVTEGQLTFGIVKKAVAAARTVDAHPYGWAAARNQQFDTADKLSVVSAHRGCFIRDLLENVLNEHGKGYYFSYLGNHLQHQVDAIAAGFGVGILERQRILQSPKLIELGDSEGFPALPNFQYELIGHSDTLIKHQAESILSDFVTRLNTTQTIRQ